MARPHRDWIPGGIYHLTMRGNNRQAIFLDTADYRQYLLFLHQSREHSPYHVLAFALMPNHIHLLIEACSETSPSEALCWVSTRYAQYFNERHQRLGHLFQGRFYSNQVDKESYFLEVTRYIHLNPFRAHLVLRAEDYPWSSYRIYLGLEEDPWGLVKRETILSLFGASADERTRRYRQFVEELAAHELERWIHQLQQQKIIPSARWLRDLPLSPQSARHLPAQSARHFVG